MMEQLDPLAPPLSVWVRWSQDEAIVYLCGDLDMVTAAAAEARLAEVLEHAPDRLVLDLRRLLFMDSAGISALIKARRALPAGRPIFLRAPNAAVSKVLRITGVDQLFTVVSN